MLKYPATILTVARWPVGGIRTYLRDLFAAQALREVQFLLVAPNVDRLDLYVEEGHLGGAEWIACDSSVEAMTRTTVAVSRARHPAFVHTHGFISGGIGAMSCTIARVPHLLTVHDLLLKEQFKGWRGRLRQLLVGASLVSPDLIHCVTHDSSENLIGANPWVPRLRRKTAVIAHGVDVAKITAAAPLDLAAALQLGPETVLFGFLGRFMAQKGFRSIVDAVKLLQGTGVTPRQARVLAVGSGGFIREDRARISALGLEEYFVFWPYQPDIVPILKGMHCLLMPSLWEASGLLAMEAMVAGVPVIGSECLGLRETLADSPAVRVRPNDATALHEAMAAFMAHPDRAAAGAFRPEAARRFSSERAFTQLGELYRRMPRSGD
jgi:glycosyltransferase involved in cell wall biosynthesis